MYINILIINNNINFMPSIEYVEWKHFPDKKSLIKKKI